MEKVREQEAADKAAQQTYEARERNVTRATEAEEQTEAKLRDSVRAQREELKREVAEREERHEQAVDRLSHKRLVEADERKRKIEEIRRELEADTEAAQKARALSEEEKKRMEAEKAKARQQRFNNDSLTRKVARHLEKDVADRERDSGMITEDVSSIRRPRASVSPEPAAAAVEEHEE